MIEKVCPDVRGANFYQRNGGKKFRGQIAGEFRRIYRGKRVVVCI